MTKPWFDQKFRIDRESRTVPRRENILNSASEDDLAPSFSAKSHNNFGKDLHRHYEELKEEVDHFLGELGKAPSIAYPKLKDYILTIIQELLETMYFEGWAKVMGIKNTFEFLVKFIAMISKYYDCILGVDESKTNRERIQALELSELLEEKLISVNHLRNMVCHELYEFAQGDILKIKTVYFPFLAFLFKKEF